LEILLSFLASTLNFFWICWGLKKNYIKQVYVIPCTEAHEMKTGNRKYQYLDAQ
jgi:hypothetical protein